MGNGLRATRANTWWNTVYTTGRGTGWHTCGSGASITERGTSDVT